MQLSAQVTRIRGTVIDADTDEPMPFVNVAITGTSIGTITSVDGTFFIETRSTVDSLVVSFMGYRTYKTALRNGSYQELNIRLEPDNIVMEEVVVHPGENPAFRILREINETCTASRWSIWTMRPRHSVPAASLPSGRRCRSHVMFSNYAEAFQAASLGRLF